MNACLDFARRRAVRPTQPRHEDPATSAPDSIGTHETALAVIAALRMLPTEQAAAVVLVDIEGFSVEEAAAILDVRPGR